MIIQYYIFNYKGVVSSCFVLDICVKRGLSRSRDDRGVWVSKGVYGIKEYMVGFFYIGSGDK